MRSVRGFVMRQGCLLEVDGATTALRASRQSRPIFPRSLSDVRRTDEAETALPVVFIVQSGPSALADVHRILGHAGHGVEIFENIQELLSRIDPDTRGCLAIDVTLPDMHGLELQKCLLEQRIEMPVIFIGENVETKVVVTAMKQGACDFLTKPIDSIALLEAVEEALHKDERASIARADVALARAQWATLTPREQTVCRFTAQGLLNKQVAAELQTRESTVQMQRSNAFKKLEIVSIVPLIRLLDLLGDDG